MPGTNQAAGRDFATRMLFELGVAYTLITVTVWTSGRSQRVLFYTSGGWILLTSFFPRHTRELIGLKPSGLRCSWWIIATALAFGSAAVVLAARLGTLHLPGRLEQLPMRIFGYVVWSFVQQFILQDYFLYRLRRLTANITFAVVATALLFALAHLPNLLLTTTALFWGNHFLCTVHTLSRHLFTCVAHALLGLCIAFTIPDAVHHGMRVGSGYATYHPH